VVALREGFFKSLGVSTTNNRFPEVVFVREFAPVAVVKGKAQTSGPWNGALDQLMRGQELTHVQPARHAVVCQLAIPGMRWPRAHARIELTHVQPSRHAVVYQLPLPPPPGSIRRGIDWIGSSPHQRRNFFVTFFIATTAS
jgi:hypothetical protein